MRQQLIQYVNLLFAGAADCEEVKQEILQNTLDRYDDLVAQGKSPEAAYRLAISGIGDINEILGSQPRSGQAAPSEPAEEETIAQENRRKHAASIAVYILCPIPLFALSECGYDTIGLCLTLILVAAATVLRLTMRRQPRSASQQTPSAHVELTPRRELHKSVKSMIWAVGLALYLILSFATGAWYITWVMFPLIGAVQGLVKAIMDLKEADEYEI